MDTWAKLKPDFSFYRGPKQRA